MWVSVNMEEKECLKEVYSEDILHSLRALQEQMKKMQELFIQKIQHTAHEEKIVDQMHAELQKYKDDMYSQLVRPVLLDVIEVRDSILRISKAYASKPEGEQDVPLKTFSEYAYDVQEILEKNCISIYDSCEGDLFDPARQRAVVKIPTPVEDLHGKVAESQSCGYGYLGKTISPEKVSVYIYEKEQDLKGDNQ